MQEFVESLVNVSDSQAKDLALLWYHSGLIAEPLDWCSFLQQFQANDVLWEEMLVRETPIVTIDNL